MIKKKSNQVPESARRRESNCKQFYSWTLNVAAVLMN